MTFNVIDRETNTQNKKKIADKTAQVQVENIRNR